MNTAYTVFYWAAGLFTWFLLIRGVVIAAHALPFGN